MCDQDPFLLENIVMGKQKICSQFMPHKLTDEEKGKWMKTSGDLISMCGQDPLLLENNLTGDETWCYQFDPESKLNLWHCIHRLPCHQKRIVCKNPRSKHGSLPSSTTKALSIRNLFLQVKPLMPNFTREFWTDCYSVYGGFGQSCTGQENGCCSTIMSLHTVWSVCANSWLREDSSCAWSPSLFHDLAPADFFLFPCLKAAIKGARFANLNAIKDRVTAVLRSIS